MRDWQPEFTRQQVDVLEDRRVFDGFFKMHRLRLRHACFEGGTLTIERELFRRGKAVAVLLFDPWREQLVLIEQFRAGALEVEGGPWLLELVAGMVEADEALLEVAVRETREEAGIEVQNLQPIIGYLPSPGGMDEWIDLCCGYVDAGTAAGVHGVDAEHEDIRVQVLSVEAVFQLLADGRLNNGAIIIAVQWLQLNYQQQRERGRALMPAPEGQI